MENGVYLQLSESPEFKRLRHAFRRFVFPMTAAFLIWYLLYVVLSAYARDFMNTKVVGQINVALVFGLLQFLSTFLIAWAYERYSSRKLEPMGEAVRAVAPGAALLETGAPEAPEAPATPGAPAEKAPAAEETAAEETGAEEAGAKETAAGPSKDEPSKDEPSKAEPSKGEPKGELPDEEEGK
ncbi:DUF485 domain-containing protein [Actinomadura rudentiformis]|uniref:DUF485 domain-containing protein n=1 Tax=Actinomadura rudentiformis TaxID=359158 RepID=A0A6H9YJ46_9ACTN|nr:DUF485 domain-containing protein [Actinomadura rudentiformis]